MRKRLIAEGVAQVERVGDGLEWRDSLDLEELAEVELSSEDAGFPIEDALGRGRTGGWRAGSTGPQRIRLLFAQPVRVRRISLLFREAEVERSQEFAVFAQTVGGGLREVRRQQFHFSPGGTTEEREEIAVELEGVTGIELAIDPDRAHDPKESRTVASLACLRMG